MPAQTKKPVIFLAHSSEDKDEVRELHGRLKKLGYQPWLDEEDLVAGQFWEDEIRNAIQRADLFLACISSRSLARISAIDKEGYAKHEFSFALTQFRDRPPGSIFLIPVRFDDCQIPDLRDIQHGLGLKSIHSVDLWRKDGFDKLLRAIDAEDGQSPVSPTRRTLHPVAVAAGLVVFVAGIAAWQSGILQSETEKLPKGGKEWSIPLEPASPAQTVAASPMPDQDASAALSVEPAAAPDKPEKPETKVAAKVEPDVSKQAPFDAEPAISQKPKPDVVAREPGDVFQDCGACPEMVVLRDGAFKMGSQRHAAVERPRHDVSVEAFALGKYEVTFNEWMACVAAGGCDHRPSDAGWGEGLRPVIDVSWQDAQQYVGWLSEKTGQSYRLPSEAEWEYAVQTGEEKAYSWGPAAGVARANCDGCGSRWDDRQTAPVGSFAPNVFGVHDLHGNVWEWVEDLWHPNYSGAPDDGTAWLKGVASGRVLRGGSWDNSPTSMRATFRIRKSPNSRDQAFGFRVARSLEPETTLSRKND